jgi:hypothetical protein
MDAKFEHHLWHNAQRVGPVATVQRLQHRHLLNTQFFPNRRVA